MVGVHSSLPDAVLVVGKRWLQFYVVQEWES